jgi:hypothetical protein
MKKQDYNLLSEDELTALSAEKIGSDPNWVSRALVAIYAKQTEEEQITDQTTEHNGVGFSGVDAGFCSSLAKWVISGKALTPKQLTAAYKIMPKYARQLARIVKGSDLLPHKGPELRPGEFDLSFFDKPDDPNSLHGSAKAMGYTYPDLPDEVRVWGSGFTCLFTFFSFQPIEDDTNINVALYRGTGSNDCEYFLFIRLDNAPELAPEPTPAPAPTPAKATKRRGKRNALKVVADE